MVGAGCKQRAGLKAAPPTTAPAATRPAMPATTQASTQPAASFMRINGRLIEFPPARLKLEQDDRTVTALLFSDDPPQAIKDNYTGNSFYLEMPLAISDPADIHLANWRHQARSQERRDTPFGIYLNGRQIQLQPYNVNATFTPSEDHHRTIVRLSGQFLLWNNADATGLPQTVFLSAELPVKLEAEPPAHP
jgi:hypothetical protein